LTLAAAGRLGAGAAFFSPGFFGAGAAFRVAGPDFVLGVAAAFLTGGAALFDTALLVLGTDFLAAGAAFFGPGFFGVRAWALAVRGFRPAGAAFFREGGAAFFAAVTSTSSRFALRSIATAGARQFRPVPRHQTGG
jgi:hypothetical protein